MINNMFDEVPAGSENATKRRPRALHLHIEVHRPAAELHALHAERRGTFSKMWVLGFGHSSETAGRCRREGGALQNAMEKGTQSSSRISHGNHEK